MTSLDPVTTSPVRLVTMTEDKDRKVTPLDLIFLHGVTMTQDKVTRSHLHNERKICRDDRNKADERRSVIPSNYIKTEPNALETANSINLSHLKVAIQEIPMRSFRYFSDSVGRFG